MSDVSISRTLFSYVIDPQVVGYDASIFTTTSGTPTVASNKYRLNAAGTRLDYQLLFGEVSVPLTIPTAPTAGHVRRIGFKTYGPANKGSVYFDITDAVLSAKVVANDGTTQTEVIPWNAAWTNTETNFRISWDEKMANFTVGTGANEARVSIVVAPTDLLNIPAYFVLESGVSDNMDAAYIQILNTARVATLSSSGIITEITPGTGATNLGKAEDAVHTSGDTGVMDLGVANEARSNFGADGDYVPKGLKRDGTQYSQEVQSAVAEDNTNGVLAVSPKPLATNTYAWTRYINLGAAATANIKSSPGNVYSIYCRNINAAVRYIQLHDTATTPAPGAVPLYTFLIAASSSVVVDAAFFGEMGANFANGIAFAFSTTETTYTAGTAGEQTTICMYK